MSTAPTAAAVLFAMTFPSLAAWVYFLVLIGPQGEPTATQRVAYTICKVVQFSFPVVFLLLRDGRWPWPSRPSFAGLGPALGFGVLVVVLILGLYFAWLRRSALLAQTPVRIQGILRAAGLATPARYAVFAGFFVVAHSLMEEYYWRWFVFGQLRLLVPLTAAVVLASLAFMAHHVILLWVFLPGQVLTAVLPCALAVAVGGAVWCLLYTQTDTIYPPWLSHLLVDGVLFGIGWDMLARAGW